MDFRTMSMGRAPSVKLGAPVLIEGFNETIDLVGPYPHMLGHGLRWNGTEYVEPITGLAHLFSGDSGIDLPAKWLWIGDTGVWVSYEEEQIHLLEKAWAYPNTRDHHCILINDGERYVDMSNRKSMKQKRFDNKTSARLIRRVTVS